MTFRYILLLAPLLAWGQAAQPGDAPQPQPSAELLRRAIESFKVRTGDLGMRSGIVDKAAAKRPPTRWHGRIFWNLRNDVLDAVPHEVTQTGGNKGILRRNQYGFSLSGPVIIPRLLRASHRTFFTVTFEGVRENQGRSFLETIATLAERTGDFSQTVDTAGALLPIFDPQSTRANPEFDPSRRISLLNLQYLRDTFPGNRIPSNRLDPVASGELAHYPRPNAAIGPYFRNNYTNYTPERNEADGLRALLDHTVSDRQRVSVGISISNGFLGPAQVYDSAASPSRPGRRERARGASLRHTFTFSPNSVNSFQVEAETESSRAGDASGAGPFPRYSFSPYLGMGRREPASRSSRTDVEIENGFSLRRGAHRVRVGGAVEWDVNNDYEPEYPAGFFLFSRGLTSLPGIVNTGHSFATFLLGMVDGAEKTFVGHPSYWRQLEWRVGAQDEWQVRPGLTVSFGALLEASLARAEKYDRQSTVDLAAPNPAAGRPGALVFANRNGYGRRLQPAWYMFQQSVGLAWSPFADSRTVLRLGMERSMEGHDSQGGQWGTQGFNAIATYFTQNPQLAPAAVLRHGLPPLSTPLPDLRPEAANDTDAHLLDLSGRAPASHSYTLSLEHPLSRTLVVRAGAGFTHGWNRGADDGANPNAIPLEALQYRDMLYSEAFNRSLRPYPQYRRFSLNEFYVGSERGGSFDLSVGKRTPQGLSLQFQYEFSRRMDNYDGELQDYYHREKEWALSDISPHRVSVQYMYELPFGPGKSLWTTGWAGTILGGWAISGTSTYSSGEPLELRARFNNTGGVVRDLYVNAVDGVSAHVPQRGPERWFNANAFVNPPDFTIGNVSRRHPSLRGPSRQNHDLGLAKRFRLSAEREVEFVGTALNFLNHANWNQPDVEIGSLASPNTNAGRIIGSRGGRIMQLGLRFSF